jgi:hypothetical protein
MYVDRLVCNNISYSGFGTTIDDMLIEYLDNGGSYSIFKAIDDIAYNRACSILRMI